MTGYSDDDAGRLLDDWFGPTREDPTAIPGRMDFWFAPDNETDAELAERYGDLAANAAAGELATWAGRPLTRLALILLLDQFPRCIHRGQAAAYAQDDQALRLCLEGRQWDYDAELEPIEQAFFWMPLQHSEILDAQKLGVHLYGQLAKKELEPVEVWQSFHDYACRHRDIIERFDRFPHRNAVLDRESTPEEEEWLEAEGETFGQ